MRGTTIPKRALTAIILAIALLFCAAVPALAAADEGANDVLKVGVPSDRCPIFYPDAKTGAPTGIGVDLMRAAAQEAGYDATFVFIQEETLKNALDNEAYDVIMPFGSAIDSASGHATIVTENLMQTPFTLVTVGSKDLPSLNELRVGMLRSLGGGAETVRQLYPGIQIAFYDTMEESAKALRAGEVDALLHNSYVWSYVLQRPAYSDLTVQPLAMFSMDFRAGALDTPAGQEVVERLNEGITALPDTLRQAIILDHTSRNLYQYTFMDFLYQYWLVLLLGFFLILAVVGILVFRHRVRRLESEERIRQLIDRDSLTGAYSLSGFRKRVEELLRKHPDVPYLLSYHNIRDFKFINDSLGMEAGDDLLRFCAAKTMESFSDEEAVGRIEADHFAALRRAGGEERMASDKENIFDPVRDFFVDQGKGKPVQVCTGVYVLTPEDYQTIDVDHMLDCARMAEKKARGTRKDGYEFYNPNQWEKGKRAADIVSHLPEAIRDGELQVWYQPQVDFGTGRITGSEALCRWNHVKLGWISPAEFIPMLERADLMFELDCFVWDKVCQDLRRWNEQGNRRFVSVNLSRSDFRGDRDIPGHFRDLVQAYGLETDQLRVEITETAFAEDPDLLIDTTVKLRELGFQVEMDDFGSGYSSLHMLKEVPVDRIKLDLHFLTSSGDPEKGRTIISYMIKMVHSLGMDLIAEGVEDVEQACFLQSQGCSRMQGFYFYKPMSVEEFEREFENYVAGSPRDASS